MSSIPNASKCLIAQNRVRFATEEKPKSKKLILNPVKHVERYMERKADKMVTKEILWVAKQEQFHLKEFEFVSRVYIYIYIYEFS